MFRKIFWLFLFSLLWISAISAEVVKLMDYPDVYGNQVVFTYAGDLWIADVTTGKGFRLTSYPGMETNAHFSPDGKWIAFTASYDGNPDVYLIPATGGEPRRLTYHGSRDNVIGWTPDGKYILFESSREMGYYGPFVYRVSPQGGFPQKVAIDRAAWAYYDASGTRVAFNRRPGEFRNWKRYHGGQAPDVWIADLTNHTFKNITADYDGVDMRPLWVGDEIYFVSDRETGINNLWAYNVKTGQFTQKTFHDRFAVYAPETDGKSIVYRLGGELYLFDIASGKTRKLVIDLPAEHWQSRPEFVNPTEQLGDFDVQPAGKWAVVEARGDLFKIKTKRGKWENLTGTQGIRERYPAVSPDGKYVAYFSDESGDYQLYYRELKSGAKPVQLTKNLKTFPYHLVWSPDGTKLLFGDKDYILRMVDVKTGKVTQIDQGHYQKDYEFFWEISEYDWSPDSKWVVYSKVEPNLNSAIYLYSLESGKITRLTDGEMDDYAPVFDRGGDYLYFISNRNFDPEMDPAEDNYVIGQPSRVCVVQLRAGEKPPLQKEEEENENENENNGKKPPFRIDLKGIQSRIYTLPIPAGYFKRLQAGKNKVFVMGKERYGFPGIEEFFNPAGVQDYFIKGFDMEEQKTVTLLDGVGNFRVSADGSHLIYRSGQTVGILACDELQKHQVGDGKLNFSRVEMLLDRHAEWRQIFNEIWRWYRDFFYDPNMHGVDWEKIRQEYLPLVDYVQTRDDLTGLVREMVGEICASHMYIFGGDRNQKFKTRHVSTGLLGADILPDAKTGLYRIVKIYRGKSWVKSLRSPLASPEVKVKEGDYLLAIDGHPLSAKENYLKYLVNKAGKEVKITVASTPEAKDRHTFTVKPIRSERGLRAWEWVKTRREMVEKEGKGLIGYMHLDDMDSQGLGQFEQGWKAYKYKKGLIIDVRYNGGGFTNYFIIDKLERQLVFGVKTRRFAPMRFPMAVTTAKMAALINEYTGSDGELFTDHFKARKLGTVIGTRTWGGLIGIINVLLTVDGGMAVQPNVGFYDFSGHWIVENHGADPDLNIDIRPEQGLRGEDPQLQKAIELLLQQIDVKQQVPPAPPAFPVKRPGKN